MEITSLSNAKVKAWMKLREKKHRDQMGQFLVEGNHLVQEADAAGCLRAIIVRKGIKGFAFASVMEQYEVSDAIMQKLSLLSSKEDVLGVCDMPAFPTQALSRLIVLDDVQDPGNLGTIIRTALSFGYEGIVLSPRCADVYNDKVIRSTQGALFHLPIWRRNLNDSLVELKRQGFTLYATALRQAQDLSIVKPANKHAIIFGNEGNGVSDAVLANCDDTVRIEMQGFESLNVAVAAGICMYEFMCKGWQK